MGSLRKKRAILLGLALSLLSLTGFVFGQEVEAPKIEVPEWEIHGEFGLGFRWVERNDSKVKVGEYDPLEDRPVSDLSLSGRFKKTYFDFQGTFKDEDDQAQAFRLDLDRILRIDSSNSRFIHRLDHIPVDIMAFPVTVGMPWDRMENSDTDPGREYKVVRRELESKFTVAIPAIPQMKVVGRYDRLTERGHQQANTVSHCNTCHVRSTAQALSQRTEEFEVGPEARFGPLSLTYAFRRVNFEERRTDAPRFFYPPPPGPFQQMLQQMEQMMPGISRFFVAVTGDNPFAVVPDFHKDVHEVRARLDLRGLSLHLGYTNSRTLNEQIDRDATIQGFDARLTATPSRLLTVSGYYNRRDLDNDATVPDNLPPEILQTYVQIPKAIDRTIDTAGIEASYRLFRIGTVKVGYDWQRIERRNFPLDRLSFTDTDFRRIETETTTHTAKVAFFPRLLPTLTGNIGYQRRFIDDPFTRFAKQGCFMPDFPPGFMGFRPFPYPDLTKMPEEVDEVSFRLTWSPLKNVSPSLNYRFIREDNDHVGRKENGHVVVASLWYAPVEKLSLVASYTFQSRNIHANVMYGTTPFAATAEDVLAQNYIKAPIVDFNTPYDEDVHSVALGGSSRSARG